MDLVLGFALGVIASGIAAVLYEYATRPLLDADRPERARTWLALPDVRWMSTLTKINRFLC